PYGCCGRPKISRGLLREAKKQAEATVGRLHGYVEDGVPVVGLEPSCVTAVTDDYRDLVPGTETERVAESTFMFEQFLAKEWTAGRVQPQEVFAKTSEPLMLHTHCQQKSVLGSAGIRAVLEWAGEEVREVDACCCGMAGSFGYTKHELSLEIGEGRLFPAVREHEGCTVSCGFSCRHQIKDGTGTEALHTAQVLASALQDS